jgi:hypothetical protein
MAAIKYVGNATPIRDTWTLTATGSWTAGDTVTITYNSKSLVITLQATSVASVTTVATTIKEAFNASFGTTLTDTAATFTPNVGGRGIPEFSEYTATSSAGVVTLACNENGKPGGTFSCSDTSAGTLTANHLATGTGPNDLNNAANYSGGSLPTTGDDLTLDRSVPIKWNLGALSAETLASLTITSRFDSAAQLGLPARNANGYEEFRATELAIGATVVTINSGSGMIKANFGSVQTAVTVYATGSTTESGRPACQLRGTHASNVLNVIGTSTSTGTADVGWGSNGETATVATVRQDTGTVTLGTAVTLTTVTKNGGDAYVNGAATTITNGAGDLYHTTGAVTTITHSGGTWYDLGSSTYTTMTINNNAVYNADGNVAAKTVTTMNLNDEGVIVDTSDRLTITNPLAFKGRLTLSQV